MNELQQLIESILKEHGCRLYELAWLTSKNPPVLEVACEKEDGTMDLDTCALLSEAISEKLDETNFSGDKEYMLEVCSPGAERELKTEEQLQSALGKYVYVKLKNPKQGLADVLGDLQDVSADTLTVAYKEKGRPKKITVDRDNVALVMTAVKL